MSDLRARLVKCFAAVFPQLTEDAISSASLETVESWDSVATITLITVIEEEFGIQFESDALEHLVSFGSILDYLQKLPTVE